VGAYLAQATAESVFDPGHPILGDGGWSVVPLALAVGLIVAIAVHAAEDVTAAGPARPTRWQVRVVAVSVIRRGSVDSPRPAPLALQAAGRAPPLQV
jgi:hypothetical protein